MALRFLNSGYFAGKVGIGTDSPNSLLHIKGADPVFIIQDTSTGTANASSTLRLGESGAGGVLDVYWDIKQAADDLNTHLEINHSVNGNHLTILDGGNVGIGIDDPGAKFEVNTSQNTIARFTSTDNTAFIVVEDDDSQAVLLAEDSQAVFGPFSGLSNNLRINSGTSNAGSTGYMAYGAAPAPGTKFKIKEEYNTSQDTSAAGFLVDFNVSGTDAITTDRTIRGAWVDLDSSATGSDTSDELRLHGLESSVVDVGNSDFVAGVVTGVRSSVSGSDEQCTNLVGVKASVNASNSDGLIVNTQGFQSNVTINGSGDKTSIFGGRFELNGGTSNATVTNGYGVYGRIDPHTGFTGTMTNAHGAYFEIECSTGQEYTTSYGVRSVIDNNGGTMGTAYQFFGGSSGTIGIDWGIYSTGAAKHYLDGKLGIGTTSPSHKLSISDSVNNDDVGIHINNTFDDNLATSNPNAVVFLNAASNNGYLRVHGAPANTAAKHQIDLGSTATSSFITFSPSSSEKMRIAADGNVGIGTDDPSSQLSIGSNAITTKKPTVIIADGVAGGSLVIRGLSPILSFDRTGADPENKILMDEAGLEFKTGSLDDEGDVHFKIKSDGTLQAPEYTQGFLQSDADGNIATTGGGVLPGGPYLPLTAGQTEPLTDTLYGTSTNWSGNGDYAGSMVLGNGASTAEASLTIGQGRTDSGYSYIDLVGGTTYSDYGLRIIRNNTGADTNSAILHRGEGNLEISANDSASILLKTNGATALTLNNTQNAIFTGDVGIATAIPSAKLHITTAFATTPSDSIFLFTNGSNTPGGGSSIIFGSSASATTGIYNAKIAGVRSSLDDGSSDLHFQTTHVSTSTAPNTKMVIKSDGKIGVGTTNPISKLEVSQNLSAASTIDYPYTISSRDDGNAINQLGGEGVGIKFRIAGNASTTPGNSLVGASIAAIRESSSDTLSNTGLGFFVTQNDETLDEALRLKNDLTAEFTSSVKATQLNLESSAPSVLFTETDVTANWRNRVQTGGYRIQYASDGTTFTDYVSLGANAFTFAKDTTFTEQAFSAATSSGDGSSTLTTKGYVDGLITGATIYRGAWDPSGGGYGSPDLSGVTQTSGYYYICSAAGTAEPNGTGCEPDSWETGDWVIWNDDIVDCAGTGTGGWQKIDNSSVLSGVGTGQTVALWEGADSVTDSETLGNAPITVSGDNSTFAGDVTIGALNSGETAQLVVNQEGGVAPVAKFMSRTNKAIIQISDNDTTGYLSSENGLLSLGRISGVNAANININASNNVGIGTSNPGAKLHVVSADLGGTNNDTTIQAIFQAENANTSKLYIQDYRTIDGTDWPSSGKRIQEKIDSTWMGYMQFNGDINNGGISFGTGQTTTQGNIAERMRITGGGTIGINKTNPSEVYQVDIKRDMTDPDTAGYAMRIDTNMSGTKSAATDILQGGIFLDIDSTAIGTTTDEHRVVGINNDVRYSGLPDAVYATQSRVESNSTQTGQCTTLAAAYNIAQSDGGVNHTVGSLMGTYNLVGVQDNSTVDNTYGTRNIVQVIANRAQNVGSINGNFTEIDLDSTNNISYGSINGSRIIIDNNQATANELGNTYLFRGQYNGVTTDDDCWGLYVGGDKHYLSSRLFLGTTTADTDSVMQVMGTDAERYVRFKTSNDESRFDFYIGGTGNGSRLSMFDHDGTTEGIRLQAATNGNNHMLGKLGVGVTSPSSKLQVAGGIQMADDTDAASATKVGTMRYRTGTEYVEVTGTELVANSDFSDGATEWTVSQSNTDNYVTFSGGTARLVFLTTSPITHLQSNSATLVSGTKYRLVVDIASVASGSVKVDTAGISETFTQAGVITRIIQPTSNTSLNFYRASANVDITFNSVSVVEVTEEDASYADMCMQTGSSTYEWVNIVRNTY